MLSAENFTLSTKHYETNFLDIFKNRLSNAILTNIQKYSKRNKKTKKTKIPLLFIILMHVMSL